MLYLQIASPKSSVLNFLDSNSFEVIISIFQRTEKVPDMERLHIKHINSQNELVAKIVGSGAQVILSGLVFRYAPQNPNELSVKILCLHSAINCISL